MPDQASETEQTAQPEQQAEKSKVRIQYTKTEVEFASQCVVNANQEEVILNFSPGYLADPQTNDRLLPIQTRIAMSPGGAARLVQTLTTALRNLQEARKAPSGPSETVAESAGGSSKLM
jgi:hypothetical protein